MYDKPNFSIKGSFDLGPINIVFFLFNPTFMELQFKPNLCIHFLLHDYFDDIDIKYIN